MKKLYNTPEATIYSTLADCYCLEINNSVVTDDTDADNYGSTSGEIDGSGLFD